MSKFAKKLQAALILSAVAIQSALSFHQVSADVSEERTFIVTAYYSPLPDQSHYLRGSYEADLRLNGNGTHGASGKPVYPGMLAAPKHYEFGTVIHLEGLGTGAVDDRGGAIVKAGDRGQEFDRIDVWMGQGDDGLRRALAWGRRTVKGRISKDVEVSEKAVSIELASVPKAPVSALPKLSPTERVWSEPIGPKSSVEMIRALSSTLSKVGYLPSGTRDAFDAEVRFALIRFQNDKGLLKGVSDSNAGYYGPSTRKALKSAFDDKTKEVVEVSAELDLLSAGLAKKISDVKTQVDTLRSSLETVGTPKDDEVGAHVRVLQEALVSLGYLDSKPTGIYGPKTRDAVASFQLKNGLVLTKSDPNAGKFGKLTKTKMLVSLAEKNVR